MIITVSAMESEFWSLKPDGRTLLRLQFQMASHYEHMVGDRPGSSILLATEKDRMFRPCGGMFPPCDYLAVGPIISASGPLERRNRSPYQRLVLDVGFALGLDHRIGAVSGRPFDKPTVEEGEWVAAVGRVSTCLGESGPDDPWTVCRPVMGRGVDLRPEASTFGQMVNWPLGSCPPHDPDVIGFPICFVSYEALSVP
ncbi:MAG TPA: hypothetical protein VGM37_12830 [Armatimonadota bacterium]|jgi:hypothetical protein